MVRVLHEKQTTAPTPSNLVFADESLSVVVVLVSRILIQVNGKLLNIGSGVAAVDVDTLLCRGSLRSMLGSGESSSSPSPLMGSSSPLDSVSYSTERVLVEARTASC